MNRLMSALLVAIVAFSVAHLAPVPSAAAGTWYVATDGSDGDSCDSPAAACATITRPLGRSGFAPGDTILVAAGTYYSEPCLSDGCPGVVLWKSANLSGGWDRSFTHQNGQSMIGGSIQINGIGLVVYPDVTATVQRFVIQNRGWRNGEVCYPPIPDILYGGGIANYGALTLVESTVKDNWVWGNGGGVANFGVMQLDRSAVTGNHADPKCYQTDRATAGGGIYNTGTLVVSNSTLQGNRASDGGGIYSTGQLSVHSSTIVENSAVRGSGVFVSSATAQNSIIANNVKSPTGCQGTITSLGYNLFSDPGFGAPYCQMTSGPGDLGGAVLVAGPLGEHGGPTMTIPLLPGSPAINGGNPTGCANSRGVPLSTDQRGVPRGGRCDIGAFEANLYVTKAATSRFRPGDSVYFSIGLSNLDGTIELDDATLRDALPIGLTCVAGSLSVTDGQASLSDANTLTWRGNVPANRPVTLNFAATIDELLASGDKIVNTAEGRWRAATESGEAKMLVASETGTPTPTPPASCPSTPTPRPTFSGALPNAGSVEPRVAHCSDDAHERVDTSETFYGLNEVTTGGGPGGLSGLIPYTGAFLFRDVRIPRYARISSARLSLGAEYQSGVPVTQVIAGDNRGNSEDFTAYHLDINLRPRTVARIPWMLTEKSFSWTTSPDIAAIIQEIVNRGDWHPGNDIGIIIDAGPGADKYANWWAVEMGPSKGARLFVSYDGVNTPTPTSTFTATSTPSSTPTGTAPSPDSWVLYLPLLLR